VDISSLDSPSGHPSVVQYAATRARPLNARCPRTTDHGRPRRSSRRDRPRDGALEYPPAVKRSSCTPLGLCLAVLSCGGNGGAGHVEISGKSPTEAGAIAAQALCTHEARCGSVSIECMGGGSAGGSGSDAAPTTSCMGVINPVVYGDCFTKTSAEIARLLTCAMLTPDQTNTLETCFDMLNAQACTTQAEADAQALASASGGPPTRPAQPAACAVVMNLPAGCN
jgi:hypothetical protein